MATTKLCCSLLHSEIQLYPLFYSLLVLLFIISSMGSNSNINNIMFLIDA